MTKEDFIKKSTAEYHCTEEAAKQWCRWADVLHECDSARIIPETGQVGEGEAPIKTAEDFLDEFMEHLEVMTYAYGIEITAKTLDSGRYFPWEMMQAAQYIRDGGDPAKAENIAVETGYFEESVEDAEEYQRLKQEMERSRQTQTGGQLLM